MNILHWKYIWYIDKCVNRWSTNLWMNKCHTNFASSNKFVFQMCFQYTILMRETYKLWMNEFYTISITKLWNAKFMMQLYEQEFTLFLIDVLLDVVQAHFHSYASLATRTWLLVCPSTLSFHLSFAHFFTTFSICFNIPHSTIVHFSWC
jgi:hypothetical protein